jgi:hypothetical protein
MLLLVTLRTPEACCVKYLGSPQHRDATGYSQHAKELQFQDHRSGVHCTNKIEARMCALSSLRSTHNWDLPMTNEAVLRAVARAALGAATPAGV